MNKKSPTIAKGMNSLNHTLSKKCIALQETLDAMSIEKWDMEERNRNMAHRITEIESKFHYLTLSCKYWETIYNKAKKDLESSEDNIKHIADQLNYQNKTNELCKIEMDKLRSSKVSDEHMARKLINLVDELRIQKEIVEKTKQEYENKQIRAYEAPPEEIRKYHEQITRLQKELECKSKTIQTLNENLEIASERNKRSTATIEDLIAGFKKIISQPSWTFSSSNNIRNIAIQYITKHGFKLNP
jgi:chromosome segregation ATPase